MANNQVIPTDMDGAKPAEANGVPSNGDEEVKARKSLELRYIELLEEKIARLEAEAKSPKKDERKRINSFPNFSVSVLPLVLIFTDCRAISGDSLLTESFLLLRVIVIAEAIRLTTRTMLTKEMRRDPRRKELRLGKKRREKMRERTKEILQRKRKGRECARLNAKWMSTTTTETTLLKSLTWTFL